MKIRTKQIFFAISFAFCIITGFLIGAVYAFHEIEQAEMVGLLGDARLNVNTLELLNEGRVDDAINAQKGNLQIKVDRLSHSIQSGQSSPEVSELLKRAENILKDSKKGDAP